MVYLLEISRTLQDTIDILNAAKDSIKDTERTKTSEHSDANVVRGFQLVENQVEAVFTSLQVRPPFHIRI